MANNIFNHKVWKNFEYNHTLVATGDSTLDNPSHVDMKIPKEVAQDRHFVSSESKSTVAQLQKKSKGKFRILNFSNDGTDTSNMLGRGYSNNAVIKNIDTKERLKGFGYDGRTIDQFKELDEHIKVHGKPDHVVLSVGGNDFRKYLWMIPLAPADLRKRLRNSILKDIQTRYLKILKEYLKRGIKPIIMTQYIPNINEDETYNIFKLMDWIENKAGLVEILRGRGKHTQVPVDQVRAVAEMMNSVYQDIFKFARENNIPIADATATHNHRSTLQNISQIEPSHLGSERLAQLLSKVAMVHDYRNGSKIYSMPLGSDHLDMIPNEGNFKWSASYCGNRMSLQDLKQLLLSKI